ncbi:hypothetical protein [Hymenobacter sp. GOD-10R]|uniref:hypothetical protein n=1 Tax=Hymenobacter sp. GOD-10R TaxID=3093922 RepID=UPI002D7863FF|nr:hypothetical protein [Hymenobacter sp. GOD-10R]WRQ31759.1 hypothetical protein SD425_28325 [Hymenobacter sp. GOD-10R]
MSTNLTPNAEEANFYASLPAAEGLSAVELTGIDSEITEVSSCFGSFGSVGTFGTGTGCLGSAGTAGTLGCMDMGAVAGGEV